ncbi:MAG: hypothetical protein AAB783_02600 [Patescibacteria group bacterium]
MLREKALAYIRKNRSSGFEDAEIRKALEIAGWPKREIDLAFIEAQSQASSTHIGASVTREDEIAGPATGSAVFGQGNLVVENIWKKKESTPLVAAPLSRSLEVSSGTKKIFLIILGILLLAGAVAGGYWYYSTAIAPNSLRVSAVNALGKNKQLSYDARFTMRLQNDSKYMPEYIQPFMPQFAGMFTGLLMPKKNPTDEIRKIEINTKSSVDWNDEANIREIVTTSLDAPEYIGSGFKYESRRFADAQYFQLSELPVTLPTVFGFDLRDVGSSTPTNVWVNVSKKTIVEDYTKFIDDAKSVDSLAEAHAATLMEVGDQFIPSPADAVIYLSKNLSSVRWNKESFQEMVNGKLLTRYKGVDNGEILLALGQVAEGVKKDVVIKRLRDTFGTVQAAEVAMWVDKSSKEIIQISAHILPQGNQKQELVELTALVGIDDGANLSELAEPTNARSAQDVSGSISRALYRGFELSRADMRDVTRMSDLEKIQQALGLYFDTKKRYPDALSILVPEFLAVLPKDPLTQKNYQYKRSGTKNFTLTAQFENKK